MLFALSQYGERAFKKCCPTDYIYVYHQGMTQPPSFNAMQIAPCKTETSLFFFVNVTLGLIRNKMRRWILALMMLISLSASAHARLPIEDAQVIQTYPHDTSAFTEGLFYENGYLYESTGLEGHSNIRKVRLETGEVVDSVNEPSAWFGEGIAPWGNQILSLTWKNGVGVRWSKRGFHRLGSFRYQGEGWGMTSDGKQIIMSDGTPELRFINPRTFQEIRRLTVTAEGRPVNMINELEYVDGDLLANIWNTDYIVRIDLKTGAIKSIINMAKLHAAAGGIGDNPVPNGIAWDAVHKRLFVTGKQWKYLYEIVYKK